ncbi:hypothetical protein BDB00DRAFT_786202 [Zychaea mexicana]|uniref:uncharacterized protein n=1 Tax=Zychaea mexicana TaxID=64656 RepID=UPI0022FE61FD|nr:uncharacterized protein BDB00DRAFT_786202 [Zychaea mexicana]KAI9495684.1 hypothetical protein BDB00DRAFT_786202 [Zychaea mexicana]
MSNISHHQVELYVAPVATSNQQFWRRDSNTLPRTVRAIEQFSFAVIDIARGSLSYDFVVEGTAEQLHLATMAMDALLGKHSSGDYYALLRVDGPCFEDRAVQIRGVVGALAPEKGSSNLKDLHIKVARVYAGTEKERRRLVSTVETGFDALTVAMEVDPRLPWSSRRNLRGQ